jgi:hypothetical protein
MDKTQLTLGVALVALVIAIGGYFSPTPVAQPQQQPYEQKAGGVTNSDNVQLTNVGTSTLTRVGCFQGYATSTLTPYVLTFNTQATTSIIGAGAANGVVTWNYGSCGAAPGL